MLPYVVVAVARHAWVTLMALIICHTYFTLTHPGSSLSIYTRYASYVSTGIRSGHHQWRGVQLEPVGGGLLGSKQVRYRIVHGRGSYRIAGASCWFLPLREAVRSGWSTRANTLDYVRSDSKRGTSMMAVHLPIHFHDGGLLCSYWPSKFIRGTMSTCPTMCCNIIISNCMSTTEEETTVHVGLLSERWQNWLL